MQRNSHSTCHLLSTFTAARPAKDTPRNLPSVHRTNFSKARQFSIREPASFRANASANLYHVMGLHKCVSTQEIKHAYRRLAKKYHPDMSPPQQLETNTAMFLCLHNAYEVLSDPIRRASYDRFLSTRSDSQEYNESQTQLAKARWRRQWESQLAELRRRRS